MLGSSEVPRELLELIRFFEGLELEAYQDTGGVWTIGYGHTGPEVRRGMSITEDQAEELLMQDAAEAVRGTILLCPILAEKEAWKLIAISDFTFNLGVGRLRTSTLRQCINTGAFKDVPTQLRRWVLGTDSTTGEKKRLAGLVKRREAECSLWERTVGDDKGSTGG